MRSHGTHLLMCGVMVVVAIILLLATGNTLVLLPAILCMGMMGAMMYLMMGNTSGRGRGGGSGEPK